MRRKRCAQCQQPGQRRLRGTSDSLPSLRQAACPKDEEARPGSWCLSGAENAEEDGGSFASDVLASRLESTVAVKVGGAERTIAGAVAGKPTPPLDSTLIPGGAWSTAAFVSRKKRKRQQVRGQEKKRAQINGDSKNTPKRNPWRSNGGSKQYSWKIATK